MTTTSDMHKKPKVLNKDVQDARHHIHNIANMNDIRIYFMIILDTSSLTSLQG